MALRSLSSPVPHNHVTVTVEADTVARIEERLDPGETVADWMRDAVVARLEDEPGDDADRTDDSTRADGRDDDPGPVYEFVDDCAI